MYRRWESRGQGAGGGRGIARETNLGPPLRPPVPRRRDASARAPPPRRGLTSAPPPCNVLGPGRCPRPAPLPALGPRCPAQWGPCARTGPRWGGSGPPTGAWNIQRPRRQAPRPCGWPVRSAGASGKGLRGREAAGGTPAPLAQRTRPLSVREKER